MSSFVLRASRGFTLIELMIVTVVTGIVVNAIGAFYLEVRASSAAIEARLSLEREASLVAEWLGRDVRGARSVRSEGGALLVEREVGTVRYLVEDGLLFRDDGERLLLGHVIGLAHTDAEDGLTRIDLSLERPIGAVRIATLKRTVLIGRRT